MSKQERESPRVNIDGAPESPHRPPDKDFIGIPHYTTQIQLQNHMKVWVAVNFKSAAVLYLLLYERTNIQTALLSFSHTYYVIFLAIIINII